MRERVKRSRGQGPGFRRLSNCRLVDCTVYCKRTLYMVEYCDLPFYFAASCSSLPRWVLLVAQIWRQAVLVPSLLKEFSMHVAALPFFI